MGNSTFSNLRVGKKPFMAGVTRLTLAVNSATAGVVGTLPAGAVILGAVASDNAVAATVDDGVTTATLTTVTAGTPVSIIPTVIAGAGNITITASVLGSTLYIEYILTDVANGANE